MAYVAHAGGQQLLQRHDAGVSRPPHHARDPGSYRRICAASKPSPIPLGP
jgi:hypothetical protein